jgi:alpha-galactosidase
MTKKQSGISIFIATLVAGMALSQSPVFALADGQALTPPMGWSSWNWFGCYGTTRTGWHGGVDETKMIQVADAMVSSGMKAVGYEYINLDDCYLENERNSKGGLVPKQATFKKGMKALADAIHSKGLKFGLYSCVFEMTCGEQYDGKGNGQPGMWGHVQQDADSMVAWGIDYLKVDWCGFEKYTNPKPNAAALYAEIGTALKTAVQKARINGNPGARDIVFSICEWGDNNPIAWAPPIGHMWRTAHDIEKTWTAFMLQMDKILQPKYAAVHGPGSWNDPDMLEVGNGLPANEDRVHFALWSVMGVPLIAGNDLTNMSQNTKLLLTNSEANAINQDGLGNQGQMIKGATNATFVVAKKLRAGNYGVLLVNAGAATATMSVTWADVRKIDSLSKHTDGAPWLTPNDEMLGRNILAKTDIPGPLKGSYSVTVPPKDAVYIKLTRVIPPVLGIGKADKNQKTFDFTLESKLSAISVKSSFSKPVVFELTDINGLVMQKIDVISQSTGVFSLKGVSPGIYIVKMKSGNNSLGKKFILK